MRAKPSPISPDSTSDAEAHRFLVAGQTLIAPRAAPGLYLVATPIGNLGDITLRALETLAGVDLIACEDTRISHRLTERYGISAPLTAYHEHNAAQARPKILDRLARGGSVALVSDAGTPLISDPGFKLVREAAAAGHEVIALPGASAVLAALTLAALPTDRFFFDGFLPHKQGARRNRLGELAAIDATLVLFEAGSRIHHSLRDLAEVLGERDAAVCRELTKLHQEVRRAPLQQLAATAETLDTRGEFVVVIGPPDAAAQAMTPEALDAWLQEALQRDSVKDAVAQAVEISGRPRREIYARARSNCGSAGQTAQTMAKTDTPAPERVAAFQTGLSAETRAAALLMAKGYRILARRFKTPYGEIDIVAQRRSLIAFVEVKARARLDDAAYAVTPRQQQRIIAAAQAWLMAHPEHAAFELRFDAVLVAPRRLPQHLPAAFDASA